MKVSIILPAYREPNLQGTARAVRTYFESRNVPFEVIVVEDGCSGWWTTRTLGGLVLERSGRLGKGRAIRDGIRFATGDVIGFMDADGKVPIENFDGFLPELKRSPIVIGVRPREGVGRPWYRRLGSRVFRRLLGAEIRDTQCGFKFFHADVARKLFAAQRVDGYMFDVEILKLAGHWGIPICQVPVTWRGDKDSRFDPWTGMPRNIWDLLRIAAIRLATRIYYGR